MFTFSPEVAMNGSPIICDSSCMNVYIVDWRRKSWLYPWWNFGDIQLLMCTYRCGILLLFLLPIILHTHTVIMLSWYHYYYDCNINIIIIIVLLQGCIIIVTTQPPGTSERLWTYHCSFLLLLLFIYIPLSWYHYYYNCIIITNNIVLLQVCNIIVTGYVWKSLSIPLSSI